ncbi:GerAB/ArcD/ProY family transporter [Paenibacillus methanolicus]|uniref:Spore germination protein KB n=1 Tax=Paenibacillus methanolicus TaxID=582686 RepID=A0A5S5CIE3_9BACL|nr:GerAB/ArcD/ProY family transporter [Paenibacillus methanolicus]TYP78130.1 spore germination protein KB [Paenibacillus methanolicus]
MNVVHGYTLLLVFLLGTSIIFGPPRLAPDAWLVELIAVVPAGALFLLFVGLAAAGNGGNLFDMLDKAWGRTIGRMWTLCYIVYFLYIASRNVRDMIELVMTSILRATPPSVLIFMFVLVIAYAASGGIAATGRLSVLIAALVGFFFFALALLLVFSGSVDTERLLPFLSEGLAKVLVVPLKSSIWFPYGELVVFLVFCSSFGTARTFRRTGWLAMISACLLLTFSDLLQTSVLGMENIVFSIFPLLDAARMISIFNFITRLDALVALLIILGVLVKCAVFVHAATIGASRTFGRHRRFAFSSALLVGAFSILVTHNNAEHFEEGLKYVIYWLHIPAQLVIPAATLMLLRIRYRKGEREHEPRRLHDRLEPNRTRRGRADA